jgi:hypothetical protein
VWLACVVWFSFGGAREGIAEEGRKRETAGNTPKGLTVDFGVDDLVWVLGRPANGMGGAGAGCRSLID